ncbi:unnamed protein product [Strongylus vulgaris]|uniref:SCP domain-containing protein n=1 Tax=Strongylus vulgaris TaxID=40348 RepID=A0A3P7JAM2_STRVU|nr:unnamed protein product [Strongylus vulgaris]
MVWANTYRLGCEIGDCGSNTLVVCRYSPKGNNIGETVYNPGATASACALPSSGYPGTLCG